MNCVRVRKTRGCVKYLKLISATNLRQYAKGERSGATSISTKGDEELVLHSVLRKTIDKPMQSATDVLQKRTNLIPLVLGKEASPILFIRTTHQLLDLGKNTCKLDDGSGRCLYADDVRRLFQLYGGSKPKERTTDKAARNVATVDSPPLKLVHAVVPSEIEWKERSLDYAKLSHYYMKLSKIRLTGLVVLTALGGYLMAPGLFNASTLCLTCLGTGLTSASANSINQFFEVPFDSQMNRTKNRVLVRGFLTPLHVAIFAGTCGVGGVTLLAVCANPLTATLGAINLFLYTLVYTPMKRYSILNTWIGSVVGAIPPVMGWTACTGTADLGALLLGAILFAWQFPHFNALSWNLRGDYSRGGYRMMSVTAPNLCRRTTIRYSIFLTGLCLATPLTELTTWTFAADSLPLNLYFTYLSWKFYQNPDSATSRKLFRASLLYLPAIMVLLAISRKHPNRKEVDDDKNKAHLLATVA